MFIKDATEGVVHLANTISQRNSNGNTNLFPNFTTSNNLFTGSAGFVNSTGGNYALTAGSAAVYAGTNSPPSGLDTQDIAGADGVQGGIVDISAYESTAEVVYFNGF